MAGAARVAVVSGILTGAAAAAETAKPRPDSFLPSTPAPSSLVLLLAGLIVLFGWSWLRSRSRGTQNSRD